MMIKDESQTESMNINLRTTTEEIGTSGSNSMSDTRQNTSEDDTSHDDGTLVVPEEIDSKGSFCCGCNNGGGGGGDDDTASRFKTRTKFWCWAVVTVLLVAAGTLTAVVVLVHKATGSATLPPSSDASSTSTDIPRTESYYQERYEQFVRIILRTMEGDASYSILLAAPNTPQYQALQWLVDDDTTIVSHNDDQNSLDMMTTTIAPIEQTKLIQRYSMMVLYYACGGEAWQMSSNAGSIQGLGHIDTCDWGSHLDQNFIECDRTTQEVIQLHLDQQRLIGQLPHELLLLSSLISLDLSYNFLKGGIPTNMFDQMVKLQTLRLNNNEFVGPLPTSIGRLQSLQQMMLGFNFFTGSLPKEYASLTELQHFHVKDVPALRGPFFSVIGEQWSKLRFLVLDGTGLTGTIPSQVVTSWIDSLVDLKLGESLFSGTFPTEIGSLTQLTNFDSISQNMIGPFPKITTLTNLKYLTVQGYDITGTIPAGIGALTALKELSIQYTSMSGTLPTELGLCTNLEVFIISNTNVTGPIPSELTSNVPTLGVITLRNNIGLAGSSIPDTLCPYTESGALYLSISCNIECNCCTDHCTSGF